MLKFNEVFASYFQIFFHILSITSSFIIVRQFYSSLVYRTNSSDLKCNFRILVMWTLTCKKKMIFILLVCKLFVCNTDDCNNEDLIQCSNALWLALIFVRLNHRVNNNSCLYMCFIYFQVLLHLIFIRCTCVTYAVVL